jgi:hypothetical protein
VKVTVEGRHARLVFEVESDGLTDNDLLYAICSLLRSTMVWLTGEGDLPDPDNSEKPVEQG